MDNQLIEKTFQNQLVLEIKRANYDFFERAKMMKYLLDEETKRHKKGTGRVGDIVAKRLGVTRVEVFRYMAINHANERTRKLINDGVLKADLASRILFNLKDLKKQDAIIDKALKGKLNTREAEQIVHETNNPALITKHFMAETDRFVDIIKRYQPLLKKMDEEQKRKISDQATNTIGILMHVRTLCGN
jgi:hypothetical protein